MKKGLIPSTDLAKFSPHILEPELFALHVGVHVLRRYAHLKKAFVEVERLRWKRIVVDENGDGKGEEHSHAFLRDGDEKRVVNIKVGCFFFVQRLYLNAIFT